MTTGKRTYRRLVEKGGLECFAVLIVQWIDKDGMLYTSADVSTPDPDELPALHEVMGTIELAKSSIIRSYTGDDE